MLKCSPTVLGNTVNELHSVTEDEQRPQTVPGSTGAMDTETKGKKKIMETRFYSKTGGRQKRNHC